MYLVYTVQIDKPGGSCDHGYHTCAIISTGLKGNYVVSECISPKSSMVARPCRVDKTLMVTSCHCSIPFSVQCDTHSHPTAVVYMWSVLVKAV